MQKTFQRRKNKTGGRVLLGTEKNISGDYGRAVKFNLQLFNFDGKYVLYINLKDYDIFEPYELKC